MREALPHDALYAHQREAWDAARRGEHVVVTTGTASGKTLAFNLPVLDALARDPKLRTLYLYPTKALAQDQARTLAAFKLPQTRAAIYDGDTPGERRWQIRRWANLILTNPDMLHVGVLPHHDRWGDVLSNLRYVVVDEAHVYRGVFGSHVANVLRRLRRLARVYGAEPQFLLASATIANPGELAQSLLGVDVTVVGDGRGAARGADDRALEPAAARRGARPARLRDRRGVAPVRGARLARPADDLLREEPPQRRADPPLHRRSRRARDGEAARALPRRLHARAAARDRAPPRRGRAARRRGDGRARARHRHRPARLRDLRRLSRERSRRCGSSGDAPAAAATGSPLLVASDDALDQYFMREPDALLGRRVEAAILDHANPRVLDGHVLSAAFEGPLDDADRATLGDEALERAALLPELKQTPAGFVWAGKDYPAARISLRSSTPDAVTVVEEETGALLGLVELERAYSTVHDGAVYLHLGEPYLVSTARPRGAHRARHAVPRRLVHDGEGGERHGDPRGATSRAALGLDLCFGSVVVTEQVVAYQRRRISTQEAIDLVALDLPETTFETEAVWYVPTDEQLEGFEQLPKLLGSLHAAEHTMIALLPLWAMCDRWDIGGLSTNLHRQTGPADGVHLRRPRRRRRDRRARLRHLRGLGRGHGATPRALPVRARLPVVRAEPEVRQPQRAARQGRAR